MKSNKKGRPYGPGLVTQSKENRLMIAWKKYGPYVARFKDLLEIAKNEKIASHNQQLSRILRNLDNRDMIQVFDHEHSARTYGITEDLKTELGWYNYLEKKTKRLSSTAQEVINSMSDNKELILLALLFSMNYDFTKTLVRSSVVSKRWDSLTSDLFLNYIKSMRGVLLTLLDSKEDYSKAAIQKYEKLSHKLEDPETVKLLILE